MTELIAFEIYRTEALALDGDEFNVEFTKRRNFDEYAIFATNTSKTKSLRAFHSPEAATMLLDRSGSLLEEEVHKLLIVG